MITKHNQGFTLIEMLVAIAVFSILVTIGVGGFANSLRAQREVAALIATQTNASLALEQMTREIRTGYLFCDVPGNDTTNPNQVNAACSPNADTGCTVNGSVWTCQNLLDFYNSDGVNVDYALQDGALARSGSGINGPFTPITGSNVRLNSLTFTIFGNTEGDNWPPRITISMQVAPNSNDPALVSDVINLQTTVSAREIDCTQTDPVSC